MALTKSELDELSILWEQDCRKLIPDFELLDEDRMMAEIESVRHRASMHGCSDLDVIFHVLRNLDESRCDVPPAWWWITASLLILPDIYSHPWYEVIWWAYERSRGKRETNTFWGSASCGKTVGFAAVALTNIVVWHGLAHVYVTAPYKSAGDDKIWEHIERRAKQWMKNPPAWATDNGLTVNYVSEEATITCPNGDTSKIKFVSIESESSVQGVKHSGDFTTQVEEWEIPKVGVVLLLGDELILNPAACAKFLGAEGNMISNENGMGMLSCNPKPDLVQDSRVLELSEPVAVTRESLNEHQDYTWETNRGWLYRFCMDLSPNRHRDVPVFRKIINHAQAAAQEKRGIANAQAQVAAWGWSGGTGNGGVLSEDAVRSHAHQNEPVWAQPPQKFMFADLAFGGSDPAGYTAFSMGRALIDGRPVEVVNALTQAVLDVKRKWVPTDADEREFRQLVTMRGGRMPEERWFKVGKECGPNSMITLQVLRAASAHGVGRGRVSFDSSMRMDITDMMRDALGTVPWFYDGTRKLQDDEEHWPMWPPEQLPDGKLAKWSDKHMKPVSAAWRLAEHLISRGHIFGLKQLKKGTVELLGRKWVQKSTNRSDVLSKDLLGKSPLWGETLSLGLAFGIRFCGALPQLASEKPFSDGGGEEFELDIFKLQPRRLAKTW